MRAGSRSIVVACAVTACLGGAACGPLRLDARPQIHGTIVAVQAETLSIRHKTGRTYRVALTRETTIVNDRRPRDLTLCPGQRATAFLAGRGVFTATAVTVWSGQCK
jgi:hypothetical protein